MRSGQLDARDVYRCPAKETTMCVAYFTHTDTLCVITSGVPKHIVRSFGRTNSEWRECLRLDVDGYGTTNTNVCCVSALSDGSLVFGVMNSSEELRVLAVDSTHAIQESARIRLPASHRGFDAQLAGGETRLAVVLCTLRVSPDAEERAVALFRVEGNRAEELARCPLREAWRPLFCGDSLLVFGRTADDKSWAVHEFDSRGGRFEPRRVLFSGTDFSFPYGWCVVNGALAALGLENETLTTYSLL